MIWSRIWCVHELESNQFGGPLGGNEARDRALRYVQDCFGNNG